MSAKIVDTLVTKFGENGFPPEHYTRLMGLLDEVVKCSEKQLHLMKKIRTGFRFGKELFPKPEGVNGASYVGSFEGKDLYIDNCNWLDDMGQYAMNRNRAYVYVVYDELSHFSQTVLGKAEKQLELLVDGQECRKELAVALIRWTHYYEHWDKSTEDTSGFRTKPRRMYNTISALLKDAPKEIINL